MLRRMEGDTLVNLHLKAWSVAHTCVSFAYSDLKNVLSLLKSRGTKLTAGLLLDFCAASYAAAEFCIKS